MKTPEVIKKNLDKTYPSTSTRTRPKHDLFAAITTAACQARDNEIEPERKMKYPLFDCGAVECNECVFGTEEGLLEAILHTLGEET